MHIVLHGCVGSEGRFYYLTAAWLSKPPVYEGEASSFANAAAMKANLVFVPPGGGEANYSLDFDLPALPRVGDYLSITRPGETGTYDFKVRQIWWHLDYPDNKPYRIVDEDPVVYGSVKELVVECEFAIGPSSCEEHKRECKGMRGITKIEPSGY